MVTKLKELVNSLRFWQITLAGIAGFLSEVANNGYDSSKLLLFVAGWLTAIVAIGSADSVAVKLGTAIRGNHK